MSFTPSMWKVFHTGKFSITIYNEIPDGWAECPKGYLTAPKGCILIYNKKSLFDPELEIAYCKNDKGERKSENLH